MIIVRYSTGLEWVLFSVSYPLFPKMSIVHIPHTYLTYIRKCSICNLILIYMFYICLHCSVYKSYLIEGSLANHTWLVDGSSSPSVLAYFSYLGLNCPDLRVPVLCWSLFRVRVRVMVRVTTLLALCHYSDFLLCDFAATSGILEVNIALSIGLWTAMMKWLFW